MTRLLEILGGIFIGVLAAVAVAAYWLFRRARRYVGNAAAVGVLVSDAIRIRIERLGEPQPELDTDEAVAREVAALESRGFERIGDYRLDEREELALRVLSRPSEGAVAVIVRADDGRSWTELYSIEERHMEIVAVGSTPHDRRAVFLPGRELAVRDEKLDAGELIDRLLEHRGGGTFREVSAENFAATFEEAFRREAERYALHGGTSVEEIRRRLAGLPRRYTDADVRRIRGLVATHALCKLHDACVARFLETGGLSAGEWEKARERLLIAHDSLELEWLQESCGPHVLVTDDLREALTGLARTGLAMREEFRRINDLLPEGRRYRLLGHVDQPLRADIWVAPEREWAGDQMAP